MSLEERIGHWTPLSFIELVAVRSEAFGYQAGVGAMETAGALISYLAEHPEDLEPWIVGGFFELPLDWIERGRLTWHSQDGKVVHPQTARFSRIVKNLGMTPTISEGGAE